jgi:hypothetical protein
MPAETLIEGQPVRRRKIDPRLPFLGAAIRKRFWRNPELHKSSCVVCLSTKAWAFSSIYSVIWNGMAEIAAGLPSPFVASLLARG